MLKLLILPVCFAMGLTALLHAHLRRSVKLQIQKAAASPRLNLLNPPAGVIRQKRRLRRQQQTEQRLAAAP